MPRTMLTNENWTRLRFILLELNIYDEGNIRLTVEGVLIYAEEAVQLNLVN